MRNSVTEMNGRSGSQAWYLQIDGSEFGPMGAAAIQSVLGSRRFEGPIYMWRPGYKNWVPISTLVEAGALSVEDLERGARDFERFRDSKTGSDDAIFSREKRFNYRARIAATAYVSERGGPFRLLGTCDDISVNGMRLFIASLASVPKGEHDLMIVPVSASGLPTIRVRATISRISAGAVVFRFGFLAENLASRIRAFVEPRHCFG